MVDVALHRRFADDESGGDLSVRHPARDQSEDLGLPRSQFIRKLGGGGQWGGSRGRGGEQAGLHGRVEQRLVGGGGLDGPGDLGNARVLGEISAGARLQRGEDRVIVSVGGQDDDLGLGPGSANPPGRLDAVEPRHPQIHEDDVRAVALGEHHGLFAVGRRGDGVDPRRDLQQRHQPFAHERLIVGDQDPDRVTHDWAPGPWSETAHGAAWAGPSDPARTGTCSSTRQPFPRGPAVRVPPRACARSRMPWTP